MALEMLWVHGIADLRKPSQYHLTNTLRKIAFLHRVFMLPCLVMQANGKPCFKKDAFGRLAEVFTPEEADLFGQISQVWQDWKQPPFWVRTVAGTAWPFRFNPLLYQMLSHKIIRKLPWFSRAKNIDWKIAADSMRTVADNVWERTIQKVDFV